jgi:glycosyltransferase involved in cell wall biosynthesis
MEAMNAGMPVVAVRSGGIAELVCSGTGTLLPERKASAIADAIEVLESNPELARRLGAAARSRVADAFNAEHVADQLAGRFRATSGLQTVTVG